jgi:hypothetical protein
VKAGQIPGNQNKWGNYFGNQTIATAILDRLLMVKETTPKW